MHGQGTSRFIFAFNGMVILGVGSLYTLKNLRKNDLLLISRREWLGFSSNRWLSKTRTCRFNLYRMIGVFSSVCACEFHAISLTIQIYPQIIAIKFLMNSDFIHESPYWHWIPRTSIPTQDLDSSRYTLYDQNNGFRWPNPFLKSKSSKFWDKILINRHTAS